MLLIRVIEGPRNTENLPAFAVGIAMAQIPIWKIQITFVCNKSSQD